MGIPLWQSLIFFVAVFVFAWQLFPSQRELGKLYSDSGWAKKASFYLERTFYQNPQDIKNTLRYLEVLQLSGKDKQFLGLTKELIRKYPNQIDLSLVLASFYENHMEFLQAAEVWLHIYSLDASQKDIKNKIISYYRLNKNTDGLLKFYELERKIGRLAVDDLFEEAKCFALKRNLPQAKETYKEIIKIFPRETDAYLRLAELYDFSKENDLALGIYRKLSKENPGNKKFILLFAEGLLRQKEDQEAAELLANVLVRFNQDKRFTDEIIYTYQSLGNLADYLAVLEKNYRENPTDTALLKRLGQLYYETKDYEKAENALRSYNEKTGGDYHTHHLLGDILAGRQDSTGSQREYREALRLIQE